MRLLPLVALLVAGCAGQAGPADDGASTPDEPVRFTTKQVVLADATMDVNQAKPGHLAFTIPNGTESVHLEYRPTGAYQGLAVTLGPCPPEKDAGLHTGAGSVYTTSGCAAPAPGAHDLAVTVAVGAASIKVAVLATLALAS